VALLRSDYFKRWLAHQRWTAPRDMEDFLMLLGIESLMGFSDGKMILQNRNVSEDKLEMAELLIDAFNGV